MTDDRHVEYDELVLKEITVGLTDEEQARLDDLSAELAEVADDAFLSELVGEIDQMWIGQAGESSLPPELAAAIERQGVALLEGEAEEPAGAAPESDSSVRSIESAPRKLGAMAWVGWAAAAVIAFLWLGGGGGDDSLATPSTGYDDVVAFDDAFTVDWATTEDPTAGQASGSVVWSNTAQSGVMRFVGLEVNDPTEFQYQLWIFDATRDERFPVDGGVFDIPPGGGPVDVEIQATLPVGTPTLFAITVERPGGVVVSSRERIALLGSVAG